MKNNLNYAVIGSGSWATAIVKILSDNLKSVTWYIRNAENLDYIEKNKHNPNYLSSVELNLSKIQVNGNINEVVRTADVIILVVPSEFINSELEKIKIDISKKIIISGIKGVVPETGLLVGEHMINNFNILNENFLVIAGPCHAEEVALERLSYLTIACSKKSLAKTVCLDFSNKYIKTKVSDDVIGIEYSSMLKNIYAIAAGIAHGLGYGDNFQSILMSNAIREIKRFIKKKHKIKRNINNSAYLGDLLVTGYSVFSRNRMFGNMIGKGYTVKSAQMEMKMIAEGYISTKKAMQLNSKNIKKAKTPIIEAVHAILYEKKSPKNTFKKLNEKLN